MTTPRTNFKLVAGRLFLFSETDRIDAQAIRNDDGGRDLKKLESHLLDAGHFTLEVDGQVIADHIRRFFSTNVKRGSQGRG